MSRTLALPALLAAGLAAPAAEPVDFRRDVRPILAEHCFLCHGPDASARKAGLRLDTRADALKPARYLRNVENSTLCLM